MRRLGLRAMVVMAALAACLFASAGSALAAGSDSFAGATVITGASGTTSGDNSTATPQNPCLPDVFPTVANECEPNHGNPFDQGPGGVSPSGIPTGCWGGSCATGFPNPALHSVWFSWTAPFAGSATFDTNGSGPSTDPFTAGAPPDTVLSVYDSPATTSPSFSDLRLVAGNDDCAGLGQQSCLTFTAVAGTTYWVALDSGATAFGGDWAGPFVLNWVESVPMAAIAVTKNASPASVESGGTITYTIGVSNAGPADASNVQVVDTLPSGTTFQSAGTSTSCSSDSGVVTCQLGAVTTTNPQQLTIVVTAPTVQSPTVLTNNVTATADNSPRSSTFATSTVTPPAGAAITVTKTVDSPSVQSGGTVTYTIGVSNAGPAAASNVKVVDTLPSGTTFQAAGSSTNCSNNSGVVTCQVGTVTTTSPQQVTIVVTAPTVTAPTVLTNNVTASADNSPSSSTFATSTVTPVVILTGCNLPGDANGGLNAKGVLHVDVETDCDGPDKKHSTVYLHHAHVHVDQDGRNGIHMDAETTEDRKKNDVQSVTYTFNGPGKDAGGTATIKGTWQGHTWTLTITDGGEHPKGADSFTFTFDGVPYSSLTATKTDGNIKIDADS